MTKLAFLKVAVFTAIAGGLYLASPAMAEERVRLDIRASDRTGVAQLSVKGTGGRYDRILGDRLPIALIGSAVMDAKGSSYKILSSELYLQPGAGTQARPASALVAPARNVLLDTTYDLAIDPNGPAAQDAIGLCNRRSEAERNSGRAQSLELPVTVSWRVTTGRFNFQWTNYDRVAPTDEIQNNRDFYADLETAVVETTAHVAVLCEPVVAAVAVNSSPAAAKTAAPESKAASVPAPAPASRTPAPLAAALTTTASLSAGQVPACNGGMVRQVGGAEQSYLCLCPGNTRRVQSGTNAFVCEKALRR